MNKQELLQEIIALKQQGLGSRKIAKELGIGKSTVNAWYSEYLASGKTEVKKPKILFYDLEIGASTVLAFQRFKINIGTDAVVKHGGHILCFSYMWMDDEEPTSLWLTSEELEQEDDSRLTAELYDLYSQADAICCHNSTSYDHKVAQTRCAIHGMPKLPTVKVLDTLLLAKKNLKLPSNSLDSVADYFNLGRKIQTSGMSLWKAVQHGDTEAMQNMVDYCKQDTKLLKNVYLRLRNIGRAGQVLNHALYSDTTDICPTCGSKSVKSTGRSVKTQVNSYNEFCCTECGFTGRERIPINKNTPKMLN